MSAVQRSQRVTNFESYPVDPFSEQVLVNVPKLTFRAEALSTKLFDQCTSSVATMKRWRQAVGRLRGI